MTTSDNMDENTELEALLEIAAGDEDPSELRDQATEVRSNADQHEKVDEELTEAMKHLKEAMEQLKKTHSARHEIGLVDRMITNILDQHGFSKTAYDMRRYADTLEQDAKQIEDYKGNNDGS